MWPLLHVYWRRVLPVIAGAVSALCLLVFGIVHLIERDWFLWWVLGSAVLGLLAFILVRLDRSDGAKEAVSTQALASPAWTPLENEAWREVVSLANRTAESPPIDWADIKARVTEVIVTVATRLHPGKEFASASFTLPDVLKAVELSVRELRGQIVERVPGSDVVQLSQLLHLRKFYEKYESVGLALWYAWRLYRVVQNPLQAAVQEINGFVFDEGKNKSLQVVKGQIARSLLLELGRHAIDLYAGRLKATQAELEQDLIAGATPVVAQAPVRIVVAGQLKSGKSSLINALMDEVRAVVSESTSSSGVAEFRLQAPDRPDLVLIDTPGLDGQPETATTTLQTIGKADLVIWTVSAANPARDIDRLAIKTLLETYASQPHVRPPSLVVAATQVDRLPPRREWSPPYDVTKPGTDKANNIRAALDQIAAELQLKNTSVVPIALLPHEAVYNIEALWVAIYMSLDDARQTSLRRALEDRPGFSIVKAVRQVWGGGRYVGRVVFDGTVGRYIGRNEANSVPR